MKIVCDNCATKYSIADEKVQGKVFKIKCKKCSHIIVVRGVAQGGDAPGAAPAEHYEGDPATTVAQVPMGLSHEPAAQGALGAEAIWHLVIDREQVGPLTPFDVRGKFAAGQIDVETYAWREGFGDWLRLGSIEDFKDLQGASAQAAAARTESTARTDSSDLFGSAPDEAPMPADPGDLFGSAPAATSEASLPASGGDDLFSNAGGGLFGAPTSENQAPVAAQASSPRRTASPALGVPSGAAQSSQAAGGEQKMTGQRNENSVLFSLNNLQALASGPSSSAPVASQAPSGPRPGYADSQSGGSGLIDIRAMASTLSSSGNASPGMGGRSDDLPGFAAAPVFSPMAAPILMPAQPAGMPKWMWGVIGLGVVAVLGIVAVGVILLTRKPELPPVVAMNTPPAVGTGAVAAPPTGTRPAVTGTSPGAAGIPTQPVAEAGKPAEPGKAEAKVEDPTKKKHEHGDRSGKAAKGGSEPAPKAVGGLVTPPADNGSAKKKKSGGDALDDLLNTASPDKPAKKAAAAEPSGDDDNLPAQLGKSDIVGVMSGKVKPRVGACFDQFKQAGMANVHLTISSNGKVSNATVNGKFAGTPTGSCVEKAVRSATFSRFKNPSQTIDYPFLLQ